MTIHRQKRGHSSTVKYYFVEGKQQSPLILGLLKKMKKLSKLKLLLIEDDTIETMKFKRVVDEIDLDIQLTILNNGEEALSQLQTDQSLPDLILLDLNMPKMDGLEFLKKLRTHQRLRYLPTVVLTTSDHQKDVRQSYETGAAGFLAKPLKYDDYITVIKSLLKYWSHNEFVKL